MTVFVLNHTTRIKPQVYEASETRVFASLNQAKKIMTEIIQDSQITWDELYDTNYHLYQTELSATFSSCDSCDDFEKIEIRICDIE